MGDSLTTGAFSHFPANPNHPSGLPQDSFSRSFLVLQEYVSQGMYGLPAKQGVAKTNTEDGVLGEAGSDGVDWATSAAP